MTKSWSLRTSFCIAMAAKDRWKPPIALSKKLTVPLIGSTLTPIVVFLPLISITGVTRTFFRALAIAMSVSLLTSLVLALVWTSNLGIFLIRRGQGTSEEHQASLDAHKLNPVGADTLESAELAQKNKRAV